MSVKVNYLANGLLIGACAKEKNACCIWQDFEIGFIRAWKDKFDFPPSRKQWVIARNEWYQGNTGWEAVQGIIKDLSEAS